MEYLNSLPKSDLIILMEFIHDAMIAKNTRQFERCISKLKRLMLYDGLICALSDIDTIKNRKPVYYQRTINFSEEFTYRYVKEGHYEKSSVMKTAFKTNLPVNWKTIWGKKNVSKHNRSMELAHAYGYMDGWTIVNSCMDDHSVTLLAIAGQKVDADQRTAAILKCIAPHYAELLKGIFHLKLKKHKKNHYYKLTSRELEVLKWITDGKTTFDISIIFGRSERVVKWHVNNIMQKLCAQNRTHAVAIAMRQGLLY